MSEIAILRPLSVRAVCSHARNVELMTTLVPAGSKPQCQREAELEKGAVPPQSALTR